MTDLPEYLRAPSPPDRYRSVTAAPGIIVLLSSIILVLTFCLAVVSVLLYAGRAGTAVQDRWSARQQRKLAVQLQTDGLADQAIDAFKACLAFPDVPDRERAAIAFAIAKLYFDDHDYANALAWFRSVELADPDNPALDETARLSIACLERLGRSLDARYALAKHTALDPVTNIPSARTVAVARFGNQSITLAELTDEIQKLPPGLQQEYASPAKQEAFVRQLITQRLLAQKARALGYDSDPDVVRSLARLEEQLLVNQLLENESASTAAVDESDVSMYYQAHTEQFTSPGQAAVSCLIFDSRGEARTALKKLVADPGTLASLKQSARDESRLLETTVARGSPVPGLGPCPDLVNHVLRQQQGLLTNLFETERGPVIVHVDSYQPPKLQPFQQVKSQAEQLYRRNKEQQTIQRMIAEEFTRHNVRIFSDRLADVAETGVAPRNFNDEDRENE